MILSTWFPLVLGMEMEEKLDGMHTAFIFFTVFGIIESSTLFLRFSPFLMACYDPDTEEFQSVCRVMSGFSDAFYKEVFVTNL